MSTPLQDMRQLLKDDGRFKVEAYQFIREALQYASENVPTTPDMVSHGSVPSPSTMDIESVESQSGESESVDGESAEEESGSTKDFEHEASSSRTRHVTGGQLCLACRDYALEQYGFLANMVLGTWGIHSTSDLGDLVYNLIRIGQMRKSDSDRREDFNSVFEFSDAFEPEFELTSLGDE